MSNSVIILSINQWKSMGETPQTQIAKIGGLKSQLFCIGMNVPCSGGGGGFVDC